MYLQYGICCMLNFGTVREDDLNSTTLTPYNQVLLERTTVPQTVKTFSAFHGIRGFITAYTKES